MRIPRWARVGVGGDALEEAALGGRRASPSDRAAHPTDVHRAPSAAATSTSALKISTARRRLLRSGLVSQTLCPAKTWPVETAAARIPFIGEQLPIDGRRPPGERKGELDPVVAHARAFRMLTSSLSRKTTNANRASGGAIATAILTTKPVSSQCSTRAPDESASRRAGSRRPLAVGQRRALRGPNSRSGDVVSHQAPGNSWRTALRTLICAQRAGLLSFQGRFTRRDILLGKQTLCRLSYSRSGGRDSSRRPCHAQSPVAASPGPS